LRLDREGHAVVGQFDVLDKMGRIDELRCEVARDLGSEDEQRQDDEETLDATPRPVGLQISLGGIRIDRTSALFVSLNGHAHVKEMHTVPAQFGALSDGVGAPETPAPASIEIKITHVTTPSS
jgi:hypothetical protein